MEASPLPFVILPVWTEAFSANGSGNKGRSICTNKVILIRRTMLGWNKIKIFQILCRSKPKFTFKLRGITCFTWQILKEGEALRERFILHRYKNYKYKNKNKFEVIGFLEDNQNILSSLNNFTYNFLWFQKHFVHKISFTHLNYIFFSKSCLLFFFFFITCHWHSIIIKLLQFLQFFQVVFVLF